MKQTAVEQAIKEIADLWSSPSDTPTYTQIFNVLENKLEMEKQQQGYSEEDMQEYSEYRLGLDNYLLPKEWFEQFSKLKNG